jgi:VanZ family protein
VTWALVIMALCWLPHGVVRKVENGSSWFEIANLDKAVHAGIFAVFGVLCLRALAGPKRAIQVVLLGLALAALTELVQELPLIGRDAGFDDVFADLVGVIAGVLIGLRIEPVFRNVEDRLFRAPAAT